MKSPYESLEEWLATEEGKNCAKGKTEGEYLRNRLWWAFMAGWNAAKGEEDGE